MRVDWEWIVADMTEGKRQTKFRLTSKEEVRVGSSSQEEDNQNLFHETFAKRLKFTIKN